MNRTFLRYGLTLFLFWHSAQLLWASMMTMRRFPGLQYEPLQVFLSCVMASLGLGLLVGGFRSRRFHLETAVPGGLLGLYLAAGILGKVNLPWKLHVLFWGEAGMNFWQQMAHIFWG